MDTPKSEEVNDKPGRKVICIHERSMRHRPDSPPPSDVKPLSQNLSLHKPWTVFQTILARTKRKKHRMCSLFGEAGKCFGHFNIINTITWLSCLFGTSAFPSPLYSARAGSPGSPPGAFLQSCFTDPESGVQEGMPLRVLTMSFRWREHEGTKGLTIPVYTHTFLLDLESMEEEGVVRASSFLTSNGRCAVYDRFFIVCSFS